jgi:hypothetical protein
MDHTFLIGSAVRCADGKAGTIDGLIINPNRNHLDYVILVGDAPGGQEIFVPSGHIQRASSRELTLPWTWADLEQLPHPDRQPQQGTVLDNLSDLVIAREKTPVRDADGSRIGLFHGAIVDSDLEIQALLLVEAPDRAIPIARLAPHSDQTGDIVAYLAQQAAIS